MPGSNASARPFRRSSSALAPTPARTPPVTVAARTVGLYRATASRSDSSSQMGLTLIEIAWGEAGNDGMPPEATKLLVTFEPRGDGTHVRLEHSGLVPVEATK